MPNPTPNQTWKFLLDNLEQKFKEINRTQNSTLKPEEKLNEFDLLKGEIDLMVDDFIRISKTINLTEELNTGIKKIKLSEDKKIEIKKTIANLNKFFNSYLSSIQDIKTHKPENWCGDLFHKKYDFFRKKTIFETFNYYLWTNLPVISDISYITAPQIDKFLSDSIENVPGGVNYSIQNIWEIDFQTLNQFIIQFGVNTLELENCVALYIVHEAFHKELHNLDRYTVEGIGDFSRVIEEADYQADVYAIINLLLYRLKNIDNRQVKSQVLDIAIGLVNTALDTTYAFAQLEAKPPYKRSQIRRVNRTLIWIYQLIKLEEAKKFDEDLHFKMIFDILSSKPIIDISGLEIFSNRNRTFFKLDLDHTDKIEIGTFKNNSIYRNEPNREGFQTKLIEGLQNLDKEKLKEALTSYLRKAGILT